MGWSQKQFRLSGGVNNEDPQFLLCEKAPGTMVFGRNYECLPGGGYRRIDGYERYDSQTSPTAATYKWFPFSTGSVAPTDQLKVVGGTSGAVGYVCGTAVVDGLPQWDSGFAQGRVALVVTSGTFQDNEWLEKFSDNSHLCKLTAVATNGNTLDDNWSIWIKGARRYWRDLIVKVPGFGSILGVFMLGGYVYAWRATAADHTVQALYKATGGAWVLQTLTGYLRFSTGTIEITEGQTITGASSGATAVVRRVSIGSGTYAGPTQASGRFAITGVTGTFSNGENLQVGGITKAVAVGANVVAAVMTATAARHVTDYHNFYAASNLRRIYGLDGVNAGYEFDGTYFCNIETGMTSNVPKFMAIHRNHLFYAFAGGSIQNGGTGTPLVWSVRTGASEIGIGDDCTGMQSNGNNTLAITGSTAVHILTGTSNQDWNLRSIDDAVGSVAHSLGNVGGTTLFADRSGINVVLPAPPTFQDYTTQCISRNVRKTVVASAPSTVDVIHCSVKNQYRLFFSDKTALVGTFNGSKLAGFGQMLYYHQFTCSVEGVDTSGLTRMFHGTDDGYVMEMDVGASFDGNTIESIAQLPFGYHGTPDRDKRFHKLTLEIETAREVSLYYAIDFDYGASQQPGRFIASVGNTSPLSSFALFGELFWETNVLSAPAINIDGVARSIGIAFYHTSAVDAAFTISAALLQFTVLGIRR